MEQRYESGSRPDASGRQICRTHGRQWQGIRSQFGSNVVTVYGLFSSAGSGAQLPPSPPSQTRPATPRTPSRPAKWSPSSAPISAHPLRPASSLNESGVCRYELADTQVLFDGVASPLIFASDGQIDAIVPFGMLPPTTIEVQVQYQGQASASVSLGRGPGTHRHLLRGLFRHRCGRRAESGWQPQFAESTRRARFRGHALGNRRRPTLAGRN